MYLIKHCLLCDREIHIHKNRITGHPKPCEHIRTIGNKQSITVKENGKSKVYKVKLRKKK